MKLAVRSPPAGCGLLVTVPSRQLRLTLTSLGLPSLNTFETVKVADGPFQNQNGIVDIQDFREWKTAFGGGSGAGSLAGVVPEPSSLILAGLAVCGLLIGAKRHWS